MTQRLQMAAATRSICAVRCLMCPFFVTASALYRIRFRSPFLCSHLYSSLSLSLPAAHPVPRPEQLCIGRQVDWRQQRGGISEAMTDSD
jgi:hypothetical protein